MYIDCVTPTLWFGGWGVSKRLVSTNLHTKLIYIYLHLFTYNS
jgi:hypothetical protein